MNNKIIWVIIIFVLIQSACNKKADVVYIETLNVTNISSISAVCGGEILSDAEVDIIERGVCWHNIHTPTISDNKTSDGTDIGTYTSYVSGLSSGTAYFIRAYYTTPEGTFYGETILFPTPPTDNDTVSDADGNSYHIIHIGEQTWMLENLKTTKYRDKTDIPNLIDSVMWNNATYGAFCNFGNDSSYGEIFGRLYNWHAVNDSRQLAPIGWHVPDSTEWQTLSDFLGGNSNSGYKLKSDPSYWANFPPHDIHVNDNSSGFTALPGGYRSSYSNYVYKGVYGLWWLASEYDLIKAKYVRLGTENDQLFFEYNNKNIGMSVRCIKD